MWVTIAVCSYGEIAQDAYIRPAIYSEELNPLFTAPMGINIASTYGCVVKLCCVAAPHRKLPVAKVGYMFDLSPSEKAG